MNRPIRFVVAAIAAACIPAGIAGATTVPSDDMAPATTAAAGTAAEGTVGTPPDLDTNGDGEIIVGVATPGPRDDGAYYEALVTGVTAISEANGWAEPIIVDNIDPSQADTELRNLARQNVDIIAVGAGELSDPLVALTQEFPDIFWYCNCGQGVSGDTSGLAMASDDSSEISYTAGFATGLLLADTDSTSTAFIGCCDQPFEMEAYLAFEAGLQAVNPDFTVSYLPAGDFNDVAGATEAYNQAVASGVGAVYPFLGGAHEAIVGLANEDGIITMSAGSSTACENEDLDYQIAVQFDAGDYVQAVFDAISAGDLSEGDVYLIRVGEFEKVGAKLCDATPEQEAALQEVRDQIAAGDFAELFGQIKGEAYGG